MRKSRLLLISIFAITTVLGGVAIWVGWRLSQEPEVTPQTGEAAACHSVGDEWNECCDTCKSKHVTCTSVTWDEGSGCNICNGWDVGDCNQDDSACGSDCGDGGDGGNGECDVSEDCTFDCSDGTPSKPEVNCNDDCDLCTKSTDICRGQATGANCQACSGCSQGGENCDVKCHCCEGKSLDDECWAHCYEKGPGYDPQAGDYPNAPYWDGTYDCRNTQIDVMVGGCATGSHVWNCRWSDGRDWEECVAAPEEALVCSDLDIQVSVTATSLRLDDYTTDLSTNITSNNVTVGSTGYDYGTDVTGATFESDPNGPATEVTIPQGTSEGTYHIWVNVTGTGDESGESLSSGCTSATSCSGGGDGCLYEFTIGEEGEPAFEATKTSDVVCINNETAARITYTIQVRNISDVEGVIEYIEDSYDSRFQSGWVSDITPAPDSHTGNVIRWDNDGEGYTLDPNDGISGGDDEIEFSYIVTVPSEYFGEEVDGEFVPYEYENFAIVKPEDQDEIELSTVVQISCISTGIFDEALTASLIGLLLITAGAVLLRMHQYTYKYFFVIGETIGINGPLIRVNEKVKVVKEWLSDRVKLTKKERFEKKALKRTEKRSED